MKISVIGTGYVGLVTGTCFAETGNDVVCVDIDEAKIESLQRAEPTIFEPGLKELIRRNLAEERLSFSTDLASAVQRSQIVFIAVGTPAGEDGSSDLGYVITAARQVARAMDAYKLIVVKSTVPVGTCEQIRREVSALTSLDFDIVSNPEFLKEGAAIEDFMKPDRVVIGVEEKRAAETMQELYAPFLRTGAPILVMDTASSEMTKYAANAMLASRISFMNEIANLCEHLGADVHWVRQGIGSDRRIGSSFLFPGIGYGGSCFPKDVKALINMAQQKDYPLKLIRAVEEVNELQKGVIIDKILKFYASDLCTEMEAFESRAVGVPDGPQKQGDYSQFLFKNSGSLPDLSVRFSDSGRLTQAQAGRLTEERPLAGRLFAVWGLSFKPQTDDLREAPSLVIIRRLLELGARVQAYDPEAMLEAGKVLGPQIEYGKTNYDALVGADALILSTEWNVFRNPDFPKMRALLKYPVIFDGRNQYNPQEMRELGFLYFGIGRKIPQG